MEWDDPGDSLPTIDEILQSTDKLSKDGEGFATIVRVRGRFAVKYSPQVSMIEAQTMRYVSKHSKVPVPRVYAFLTDEGGRMGFIVMEYKSGVRLDKIWASLPANDKYVIEENIRSTLGELESIDPPDFLGSVNREPYEDGVFYVPEHDPQIQGPFANEEKLNEGILRKLATLPSATDEHQALMRSLVATTLRGHRTVFTHGDLQPKNILVDVSDRPGPRSIALWFIDWEISGWYPEYWEFCNAMVCGRFNPDWLGVVQRTMRQYHHEYLMMLLIRNLIFY